jgi:diketogulonate reductase-like aldo/keto reductase
MACSPLDQGQLRTRVALKRVAKRRGVSPECVAIAWTLRHPEIVSIPKASNPDHVRSNFAALNVELSAEDLEDLDGDYPA